MLPVVKWKSAKAEVRGLVAAATLAGASATFAGCSFPSFTMPGQKAAGIGGPSAGNDLVAEADRGAGLHWKAPWGPSAGRARHPPYRARRPRRLTFQRLEGAKSGS